MWTRTRLLPLAVIGGLFVACGGDSPTGSEPIGGDTDLAISAVGNTIPTGSINLNGTYYNVGSTMTVTANNNGLTTLHLTADLANAPALQAKVNAMASSLAGPGGWVAGFLSGGTISTDIKLRITSEGIQDYFNADKKLQTLVRYDAKVGDTYRTTLSDGSTITRTVTKVSTTDDFPYGLFMIKTIKVEQDSHLAGVRKFIYHANHRFGLVWVEAQMEDGTTLSYYVFPNNY
jgi:hypothetical protein